MKPLLPLVLAATVSAEPLLLKEAEVRLPFSELRPLLESSRERPAAPDLPAALTGARLRLSWEAGRLVIDASFRTVGFADGPVLVPLIGGAVMVDHCDPADTVLLIREGMICHALAGPGSHGFAARMRLTGDEPELRIPACPAAVIETGGLPADRRLVLTLGKREKVLAAGASFALPAEDTRFTLSTISAAIAERSLRPPEPSSWSWQHLVGLRRVDGELEHLLISRASAAAGSGLEGVLVLPADARGLKVAGADLESFSDQRREDGASLLELRWKSRDVLERELSIRYLRPLRPLDPAWELIAPGPPGEEAVRSRFIVDDDPQLAYASPDLAGPFPAEGLPAALRSVLLGESYYALETDGHRGTLGVRALPLVTTAEATVPLASWSLRVEGDGSLLAEGVLEVRSQGAGRMTLETPPGFSLLSCSLNGAALRPVDRGEGLLEIPLPPSGAASAMVALSFTGRTEPLDPVEGTLALALPRTPLFINTLRWRIDLPAEFMAETHGNVNRAAREENDPPSVIRLSRNLCHDESPAVSVFYQRADLRRP